MNNKLAQIVRKYPAHLGEQARVTVFTWNISSPPRRDPGVTKRDLAYAGQPGSHINAKKN